MLRIDCREKQTKVERQLALSRSEMCLGHLLGTCMPHCSVCVRVVALLQAQPPVFGTLEGSLPPTCQPDGVPALALGERLGNEPTGERFLTLCLSTTQIN